VTLAIQKLWIYHLKSFHSRTGVVPDFDCIHERCLLVHLKCNLMIALPCLRASASTRLEKVTILLISNLQGEPRAMKVATSLAIPGRRIGRADAPDRARFGHFAKKVLGI
jgi:hypothetical protein